LYGNRCISYNVEQGQIRQYGEREAGGVDIARSGQAAFATFPAPIVVNRPELGISDNFRQSGLLRLKGAEIGQ